MESERLLIRAPKPGDGATINAAIVESFNELKLWLPWAQKVPSLVESETFACEAHDQHREKGSLPFLLFRKEDGALVGASGFPRINWDVPMLELGYWCRSSDARAGYISEAAGCLTRFAFERAGANRVEIRVDSRNRRSCAVAERLGYSLDGTLRNDAWDFSGQSLRDTRVYSMVFLKELRKPEPSS